MNVLGMTTGYAGDREGQGWDRKGRFDILL